MIDCLVYFGIFGLVFALNVLVMFNKNKRVARKVLLILSFLVLLLFIGFRYNVGTDYDNYLLLYDSIMHTSWDKLSIINVEPFVAMLFKACSCILPDPKLIFIVLGGLMLYPIYKINKLYDYKYLAYSILTFCIMFLPFGLNGMRQGIAMSFALLSFVYFVKKDVWRGLCSFIIAVLFHMSAFLVAPYLLLIWVHSHKKIRFTTLNIMLTVLLSVVILFFLNNLLIENGIMKYDYMLGSIDVEKISFSGLSLYLPVMLLMFLSNDEQKDDISIYKNLAVTGFVFLIIGTTARYLSRFALYFLIPSIIMLPMLVQNIAQKNNRIIVKVAFIVYLMAFFYVQCSINGWYEILPYRTWLFGGIG